MELRRLVALPAYLVSPVELLAEDVVPEVREPAVMIGQSNHDLANRQYLANLGVVSLVYILRVIESTVLENDHMKCPLWEAIWHCNLALMNKAGEDH